MPYKVVGNIGLSLCLCKKRKRGMVHIGNMGKGNKLGIFLTRTFTHPFSVPSEFFGNTPIPLSMLYITSPYTLQALSLLFIPFMV